MNYISYEQAKELFALVKPTDISGLEADLAAANSSIGDLTTDLESVEGDITTLQGNITAINTTLTTLQTYHQAKTVTLFAEVEYEVPETTLGVDLFKTHSSGLSGSPLIATFPEGSFAVITKDDTIILPSAYAIKVADPDGKAEDDIDALDLFQGVAKGSTFTYTFAEAGTYTIKFYTKGGNTNGIVQGKYDDTSCPTYPQLFRAVNVPFVVKSLNFPTGTTNIQALINENEKITEFGSIVCPSAIRYCNLFNGAKYLTKIGDIKLGMHTVMTDNQQGTQFFQGCSSLTEIGDVILENVKYCDDFFQNCKVLEKVGRVDVMRDCVSFGTNGFFGPEVLPNLTSIRIATLPISQYQYKMDSDNLWIDPIAVTTTTGEGDDAVKSQVPLVVDFTRVPNLDEASFKYMSLTVNAGKATLKFTEDQKTNYATYISNLESKGYTIA